MQTKDVVLRFAGERPDFKGSLRTFMSPVDQVAFERHYHVGITKFEEEGRVEWVLWLVWRAYAREQQPQGPADFEAFLDELDEFDLPDEVPAAALMAARRLFELEPELAAVKIDGHEVTREGVELELERGEVDPTETPPPG